MVPLNQLRLKNRENPKQIPIVLIRFSQQLEIKLQNEPNTVNIQPRKKEDEITRLLRRGDNWQNNITYTQIKKKVHKKCNGSHPLYIRARFHLWIMGHHTSTTPLWFVEHKFIIHLLDFSIYRSYLLENDKCEDI